MGWKNILIKISSKFLRISVHQLTVVMAAAVQKMLVGIPKLAIKLTGFSASVVNSIRPSAGRFIELAKVEYRPPSPAEVPLIMHQLNQIRGMILKPHKIMNMTVNEVGAYTLVAGELSLLFYLGEVLGRRSLRGYNPKIDE